MIGNAYPYTDFHELNLDFVLKQTQANTKSIEDIKKDVSFAVSEWISEHINEIMVDATYDADTETITLSSEIAADGIHVYSAADKSMTIV